MLFAKGSLQTYSHHELHFSDFLSVPGCSVKRKVKK